jgi:phospholipid/cholesterol/gamma-HCH transport system substrate-binding protein
MFHSKLIETVVGLFVAMGLGALFLLTMQVSNLNLMTLGKAEGYEVRAKFENIGGLKVRAPVKMAGVLIGRVSAIEFDDATYEAVAVMRINPRFDKIPADTTADIYTAGLLGEQYISLNPGGEETFLKNGDAITLTQSAVVLEQLIGQLLYEKAAGDDSDVGGDGE